MWTASALTAPVSQQERDECGQQEKVAPVNNDIAAIVRRMQPISSDIVAAHSSPTHASV